MLAFGGVDEIRKRCGQWAPAFLVGVFLFFPLAMALGHLMALSMIVLFLLSGRIFERLAVLKSIPAVWVAIGLYVVVLVGITYTDAASENVILHLSKYGKLLVFPIAVAVLADEKWRARCMNAYTAALLFILISVYASIWWHLPWSKTQNLGWGVDHTVIGDYITQSVMMTFFVVIALDRGLRTTARHLQWAWWTAAFFGALSITHLSSGRTGYVLLVGALAAYMMAVTRGAKRWLVLGALVVATATVAWTSSTLQQRVRLAIEEAAASDRMEITSIGGRINFWKNTWALIEQRPLVGWGTGSYHEQWCRAVNTAEWCAFGRWHPHNQFLFFWMENGLLGFLLYASLVGIPLWAARRAPPAQRGLLWSFAAIFFLDSMVNSPLWSSRENHFFVFMLALLCANAHFSRTAGNDGVSGRLTRS